MPARKRQRRPQSARPAAPRASNPHPEPSAPGTHRHNITLPDWHDARLRERMDDQGIGRSEALRQVINESHERGSRLRALMIRQHLTAIRQHCQSARLQPSRLAAYLTQIETAADEIAKLAATG